MKKSSKHGTGEQNNEHMDNTANNKHDNITYQGMEYMAKKTSAKSN